ncbi:MAG: acetyl-CoA carboxylase biotin carboxyl carrier protein subunit, partial [Micropruina sp.]|uniref:acetyl-CoA carboxylase biotin carboxyl carrier protein subunit n=1 Tax=Micropruina sp. TaxID=2737536 RepID=UPI0039E5C9BB
PTPPPTHRVTRPAPARGGDGVLTAPMPGVVVEIDVAVGDTVSEGQTLLVLEAMKMRNDLKAQQPGVVRRIEVQAGDQVRHGDLLLEIES